AVTLAGGRIRLCQLGPAAEAYELIDRLRFALHRLGRQHASDAGNAAASALLADAARRLDALLIRPVSNEITNRPLVVVPTGALQLVPWSILPSCAGRPVTVTPSAALWLAGLRGDDQSGPCLVAAGPGLPGADTEAAAIADLHQVTALTGAAATVEAVTAGLDGARMVHLAAHGRIHPDNPLFTSLTFADGPLTVYDVEQLRQAPRLVVLAACDVGRSAVRAGDELLGLSATFLALGPRPGAGPGASWQQPPGRHGGRSRVRMHRQWCTRFDSALREACRLGPVAFMLLLMSAVSDAGMPEVGRHRRRSAWGRRRRAGRAGFRGRTVDRDRVRL